MSECGGGGSGGWWPRQKWKVKLIFLGTYRLSGTGIVEWGVI